MTEENLAKCNDKASVESLWERYKITEYREKIKLLRKSMGNPITFCCFGKEMDEASEYAVELEIFILGEWRIVDLYKRAGIGI